MDINTGFDFRSDSNGKDPDAASPALHAAHQFLWSKPLPTGGSLDLEDRRPVEYLVAEMPQGTVYLSSDSVIPTFRGRAAKVISQLNPGEFDEFDRLGYTIGGMMLFPSNRVNGKMTINGARIRGSPIASTSLSSASAGTTQGRRVHSALSWTGTPTSSTSSAPSRGTSTSSSSRTLSKGILSSSPFHDFTSAAVPQDVDSYREYVRKCTDFLEARNRRIENWVAARA